MSRVRREDTPAYAADVIEGAKPISSQLAAAAGLLTILLVAMSAMEAPMQRQNLYLDGVQEMERPSGEEPGLLCFLGGTLRSWMTVEAS